MLSFNIARSRSANRMITHYVRRHVPQTQGVGAARLVQSGEFAFESRMEDSLSRGVRFGGVTRSEGGPAKDIGELSG